MLSRSASNLYWMGRYLERADFQCRLIDATTRLASLPASHGGAQSAWESATLAAAVADHFADTQTAADEANVGFSWRWRPTIPPRSAAALNARGPMAAPSARR